MSGGNENMDNLRIPIIPRRPYSDDYPGYHESDRCWFENNRHVVIYWMEEQVKKQEKEKDDLMDDLEICPICNLLSVVSVESGGVECAKPDCLYWECL